MDSNIQNYSEFHCIQAHTYIVFELAILKSGNIVSASRAK